MTVTIDAVVYGDGSKRAAFRATDETGISARYISFGSLPRCPVEGECWSLEYVLKHHPQYGTQRHVITGNLIRPAGAYIIYLLAKHPALRGLGVGPVTARRLYDKYGPELATILSSGNTAALEELDGDIAYALCERWQALALEPDVLRWIDEHGLDTQIASKVVALYGDKAIEAMEANPYVLLPFLSFDKIDAVARSRLGVDQFDPRRMVAAVEAVLYDDIQQNGNTAMPRPKLAARLRPFLAHFAERAIALALDQAVKPSHHPP